MVYYILVFLQPSPPPSFRIMSSLMTLLTLLVASSLCCGGGANARAAPAPSDLEEPLSVGLRAEQGPGMSDALKYLEELDKYYSQAARPRYVAGNSFQSML